MNMSSSTVLFHEKLLSWPAMNCSTSTSTPSLSSSGYFLLHPNSVLLLLLSLQVVIFANTRVLFCDCSKDQCQFSFCIFLSFWLIETDEKIHPFWKSLKKSRLNFHNKNLQPHRLIFQIWDWSCQNIQNGTFWLYVLLIFSAKINSN